MNIIEILKERKEIFVLDEIETKKMRRRKLLLCHEGML